jgi:hypothetical protein
MYLCGQTLECEINSFVGNFNIICQYTRRHTSDNRNLPRLNACIVDNYTVYTSQYNNRTCWTHGLTAVLLVPGWPVNAGCA